MPLLLAIAAVWSAVLLLVVVLCLAARQGDRQQSRAPREVELEPYLTAPVAAARARVLRGLAGGEGRGGREVPAAGQVSRG